MLFLKEDTSVTVRCGPFVSPTDGYTAVTNAAPTVYISKAHGAFAARNGTTWTHDRDGWYACQLSATDTDTAGTLVVEIAGSSTYLPVFMQFQVVNANVFDSLFASAATDYLQVDTYQVNGTTQTARDLGASVLLSSGTGAGQISLASGAVTVGTNNDKTGYTVSTVSDKTGYSLADATSDAVIADAVWNAATSGYGGAGSYGEKVEGLNTGSVTVTTNNDKTGYALADATSDSVIADAVWNAATASYGTANTYGEKVESLAGGLTGTDVENAVWNASRASHATAGTFGEGLASVQGNVTGSVGSVTSGVTLATGAVTAAAIATGAIDADALATDAVEEIADGVLDRSISEPSGVWAWPSSLRNIIRWVGALSRNKITQTSGTQALRNDADSGNIATSTVSDAGGTTTRGEWT